MTPPHHLYFCLLSISISKLSIIIIPSLILLDLGSACGLSHNNLIDLENGDGGIRSQPDRPFFGLEVVDHVEGLGGFDGAREDVDPGGLGGVGCDHLWDDLVGVQAGVLREDTGDYLEAACVPAVGVVGQVLELFGLLLELDREDLG